MAKQTTYGQLSVEKKRQIRKALDGIDANLKKTMTAFDDNFFASIREERNCIKLVKTNQMTIEQFQDRAKKLGAYRKKFFAKDKEEN